MVYLRERTITYFETDSVTEIMYSISNRGEYFEGMY